MSLTFLTTTIVATQQIVNITCDNIKMTDEKEVFRKRGRASKAKGKRYEKEIADLLSKYFPGAKPGRQQTGPRDKFLPDVNGCDFWVECKSQKRTNPKAALEQAEQEAKDANDPRPGLVFAKDPPVAGKKNEFVCMRPETLLALFELIYCGEVSQADDIRRAELVDLIEKALKLLA